MIPGCHRGDVSEFKVLHYAWSIYSLLLAGTALMSCRSQGYLGLDASDLKGAFRGESCQIGYKDCRLS